MNARGLQASPKVGLGGFNPLFLALFFLDGASRWGNSSVPAHLARMGSKRVMFLRPMRGPSFAPRLDAFPGPFLLMVGRGGGS